MSRMIGSGIIGVNRCRSHGVRQRILRATIIKERQMPSIHDRRSFVSVLASLAGLAVIGSSAEPVAAQAPATPGGQFDLTWLDQLKGKHKQVYDFGGLDLSGDPRALRFARNFLDTFRDVYKLEGADINTAIGISG